jgi:antitoxin HigA-1
MPRRDLRPGDTTASEPAFGPTHPGQALAEDLEGLGVSVARAARLLGVSRQALHNVLAGRASVTPEMALRIGKLIGNGPTLWLEMQRTWDLDRAKREIGAEIEKIETIRAA